MKPLQIYTLVALVALAIAPSRALARNYALKYLGSDSATSGRNMIYSDKVKHQHYSLKIGPSSKIDSLEPLQIRAATVLRNVQTKKSIINDIATFDFTPTNHKAVVVSIYTGAAAQVVDNWKDVLGDNSSGYQPNGVNRTTVNLRLWRVKHMITWALDEALISATEKAELTQVQGIKRGRTAAPERELITPIDDDTLRATVAAMMPNTADMVMLQRHTGMRPCELCALRWSLIDRTQTPWVYRVPATANKNQWRGELGMPRVVCLGPKAREILLRHKGSGDIPFSPMQAMAEHIATMRANRKTPLYGKAKNKPAPHVARKLRECWTSDSYGRTIRAACMRAGVTPWGANRLRHTFGTEVRRKFGLDATKAVLGHTDTRCITDVYTFDAIIDETIRRAAPAVEALG